MMKTRVLAHFESTLARTALMLAAVVAVTAPAAAADMKGEYGARSVGSYPAVPVPAPIPIPDTFSWYIRGDAGYALKSNGNVSVSGTPQIDIAGPGSHDGPFSGSFAFGRYISPSLRSEFGIDVRNQQTIGRPSNYSFTRQTPGPLAGPLLDQPTTDTNTYLADRQDSTSHASHTIMANLYYDVKTGGAFTPYIGAGVGVNISQMRRSYTESAACQQSVNSDPTTDATYLVTDPVTGLTTRVCSPTAQAYNSTSGAKGVTAYGPALALMAGTSVQLRPGVSLDAGYRMMWQGATPSIALGSVMGDISKIAIGARTDHELRLGMRWDIW